MERLERLIVEQAYRIRLTSEACVPGATVYPSVAVGFIVHISSEKAGWALLNALCRMVVSHMP